MFRAEAEMTELVERWLGAIDLVVKREFISPWGICDLVGINFDETNVSRRQKLRQSRSVSSLTRAALLLRIPDIETGESLSLEDLVADCCSVIPRKTIEQEITKLVSDRFIIHSNHRLQKVNGWMPLHKRLISVELKLTRVEEALSQARNNLGFADESYVALPLELAAHVSSKKDRRSDFVRSGIGLLGVSPEGCRVFLKPQQRPDQRDSVLQFYCVEKFWGSRGRLKCSST